MSPVSTTSPPRTDRVPPSATHHPFVSVSGAGNSLVYQYDLMGRRSTVNNQGVTTNYLYDGLDVVREVVAGGSPIDYLKGLSLDETFGRTGSDGFKPVITDHIGSTIGLSDDAGNVATGYTYEPYGATSAFGAPSTNHIAFTGRENDGAGLYYIRSRYYSPTFERFISEDALGSVGGINRYAYAHSDTNSFVDPLGGADGHHGSTLWNRLPSGDFFRRWYTGPLPDTRANLNDAMHRAYSAAEQQITDAYLSEVGARGREGLTNAQRVELGRRILNSARPEIQIFLRRLVRTNPTALTTLAVLLDELLQDFFPPMIFPPGFPYRPNECPRCVY